MILFHSIMENLQPGNTSTAYCTLHNRCIPTPYIIYSALFS